MLAIPGRRAESLRADGTRGSRAPAQVSPQAMLPSLVIAVRDLRDCFVFVQHRRRGGAGYGRPSGGQPRPDLPGVLRTEAQLRAGALPAHCPVLEPGADHRLPTEPGRSISRSISSPPHLRSIFRLKMDFSCAGRQADVGGGAGREGVAARLARALRGADLAARAGVRSQGNLILLVTGGPVLRVCF